MKTFRQLFMVLLLLCSVAEKAQGFELDGIYYGIQSQNDITHQYGVYVTAGNNKYSGNIVIPASFVHPSDSKITCTVIGIGWNAFGDCTDLISVEIPNTVTYIAEGSFKGCTELTSINIPESVKELKKEAFKGCTNLSSIVIPNSVVSIGADVFDGTAFYNNQPDGIVYINNILYKYKGTMPAETNIVVDEGMTSIAWYAFSGQTGLVGITIPQSVTSIEPTAFEGCSGLTSITIPNSVTSIGISAFRGCI